MTNDTSTYRVLELQPQSPQGACCTNFPECSTLLAEGRFFVGFFPNPEQDATAAVGVFGSMQCPRCETGQVLPITFPDLATAQERARMLNAIGHGRAPLINFRPRANALVGIALSSTSAPAPAHE